MNKTDISILLDRSGSMGIIRNDTIGGFNTFLEDQQKLSDNSVLTLVQFESGGDGKLVYDKLFDAQPIHQVPRLTPETFVPGGSTPLLDALGRLIDKTGKRLAKTPESERPDRVLVLVITDGEENSSRKFSGAQIKQMIEHQTDVYKWEFVYIGANQDAITTAESMGIKSSHSANYAANAQGTEAVYASVSRNVGSIRSEPMACFSFEDDERAAMEGTDVS